jgi:hypothetical protein
VFRLVAWLTFYAVAADAIVSSLAGPYNFTLSQPDAPNEVSESGIGAQRIHSWIDLEPAHMFTTHFNGFLEPLERQILLSEAGVDERNAVG